MSGSGGERARQVWQQIAQVTDPELDQAVTDLDFIERCEADGEGGVYISYRLPTYWCAANFAFMMGHDMKEAAAELAWADTVRVELLDHFYADEINRGLADDASFTQTCNGEAAGDLTVLRATFRHKAFMARQERVLQHLLKHDVSAAELVAMRVAGLAALDLSADARGDHVRERYLALRRETTLGDFSGAGYRGDEHEWAFVTATGRPLAASELIDHLRRLRSIRLNSEFNAGICSGVLAARKQSGGRPTARNLGLVSDAE
jgi:metal-sulfur cluster biosynthetic enzyme